MINEMPMMEMPAWLREISERGESDEFPLLEILQDSLYYASAGKNGTPVKFLGGNILSHIYADYGVSRREFLNDLNGTGKDCGFLGYSSLLQRDIRVGEIVPRGWIPPLLPDNSYDRRFLLEQERRCDPFGHWSVWKRKPDFPPEHGPEAFSFLYFGGEMSCVYQAIFNRHAIKPKVLTIIQPGSGFGGGWEHTEGNNSFFKRVVQSNPAGMPEYLLFGGFGCRSFYEEPCWKEYQGERLVQLPERQAGLWRLSDDHRELYIDAPPALLENTRHLRQRSVPEGLPDTLLYELLLYGCPYTRASFREEA